MFDLERMKEAVESESFRVPTNLTTEQMRFLILLPEKTHREIQSLTDENMKGSIKELMFKKKVWDEEILTEGGVSYYKLDNPEQRRTSDGTPYKEKYRVACTKKREGKLLKFRVRTPTDEIFSVQAKTCGEAQFVVNSVFGAGMFRVSQMLY